MTPKQKRWQLKRDLEQALGNLEQACEYIVRVAIPFKGVHDDYYNALQAVCTAIQLTRKTVNDIKDLI